MTHPDLEIRRRPVPAPIEASLRSGGMHPVLARLYAARGVRMSGELDYRLGAMLPPQQLRHAEAAAALLADAIVRGDRMLIVADYDCDGATACAVGLRGLRAMGARVDFFVPNRFELGYGLTPELVDLVAPLRPELLITVDNGIASIDGVARANALGMRTLITDHHLPADELPAAACIVNPNQPRCEFPSKSLAGVGVMFYVLAALRAEMRRRSLFSESRPEPNLGALLDLVAVGTVADVVRLDQNNRILVSQGLQRIRAGNACVGIRALFAIAGRKPETATTFDLGFAVGPRINAAGRLSDMRLGIECLATDDMSRALEIARQLDELNRERRSIESGMRLDAEAALDGIDPAARATLTLFDPSWHQGVVGILAGRIKDRCHRPTFAFAPTASGELRGSGRSIAGLHLRDCLDLVSKQHPTLLRRFGGHAAAAGVTIAATDVAAFEAAFEATARRMLDASALSRVVETDGALEVEYMSYEVARMLEAAIWGQGFPGPLFADDFVVRNQRIVGGKHLRLHLELGRHKVEGIFFNQAEPLPERAHLVYRLRVNEYNGLSSVEVGVEHTGPVLPTGARRT